MISTGASSVGSCPARAALAGNPSDGHGGAVVATTLPAITAKVTIRVADRFTVDGSPMPAGTVDVLDERCLPEDRSGTAALVAATIVALRRLLGAAVRPVAVDVSTTIPRSVGLAGSSAIVIATMRALVDEHRRAGWSRRLRADTDLVASVALAAERDVLGIAAGPQDRVVQAYGGTVWMDFRAGHRREIAGLAAGSYRSLPPPPGPIFVACRPETAGDSGAVHAGIDPTVPGFAQAMHDLASQAELAAAAIERRDAESLGAALDATFDLRASVIDLEPTHVEMIEIARSHGASANFTGSGGSIVVSSTDHETSSRARAQLADELGCVIVPVP